MTWRQGEGWCQGYGNALFTVINKYSLAPLLLVQTVAVRRLTSTKKRDHIFLFVCFYRPSALYSPTFLVYSDHTLSISVSDLPAYCFWQHYSPVIHCSHTVIAAIAFSVFFFSLYAPKTFPIAETALPLIAAQLSLYRKLSFKHWELNMIK